MKPSIVIYGLDRNFLSEIVEGLIGKYETNDENLYDWTIDTKYYTVDVHVQPLDKKILVEESIADSAQVLIVLIDPSELNNCTKLDSWLPFLSVLNDCETKLLVARNLEQISPTMSKTDVKQWCTNNQYELLELEKTSKSEADDDDDADDDDENSHLYQDVYGIPRLLQTLHVHQWPNMNLKDRREINRNLAAQLKTKLNFDQETAHMNNHQSIEKNEQIDSSLTSNNHHDIDPFGMENIFEQMKRYKEEADRLTGDERKEFAEKVILSLWKDIGDDDDDDDDNDDE